MTITGEVVDLDISLLADGPMVRSEPIDHDHSERLRAAVDQVPAILVRQMGERFAIVDGHHRRSAATKEGRGTIRAVVVDLTDAEALEAATKANTTHGLPLNANERKRIADRMVRETDWSDARIATCCGLSDKTIGELRPRPGSESPNLDSRKGADDKSYPAGSGVAAARRRRVREALEKDPDQSLRELARAADVSPTTAADEKAKWLDDQSAGAEDEPPPGPSAPVPPFRPVLVPPVEAGDPMIEEIVVLAPTQWAKDERCQRSNTGQEFGRFMDRFTRWNDKAFGEWVDQMTRACPPDLRIEAEDVAKSMAAGWARLAAEISKPTMEAMK